MVRRFINASKIEIYKKKNPTAAAHGGVHTYRLGLQCYLGATA
jgi:hypothetical protein